MLEDKDETILARWINGELSPGERAEFEESEAYRDYQRILTGMERFKKPPYRSTAVKEKVQLAIHGPKRSLSQRGTWYGIAAGIAVLLGLALYFHKIEYVTPAGERLEINLPDGSTVLLNSGSRLSRERFFWTGNRALELAEGEAFFKVEKGDGFQVKTEKGTVAVLGTKFNIKSRKTVFEVGCYEGKVRFTDLGDKNPIVLTKGKKIALAANGWKQGEVLDASPNWTKGQSVFENVPLWQVLEEMELQYGIEFTDNNMDTSKKFSGSFVHDDLETALKAVLVPMGISYTLDAEQKTVLLNP